MQLRQDAARLCGMLLWDGTATGGSTTAITATGNDGLRDSGASGYLYEGAYAIITDTTDDAAPLGQWRMVTPSGYDPTSPTLQLTVGEPFTAGVDSGDTIEIIAGLTPPQWNKIIDDVLTQRIRMPWRSPLSLIDDADMESSLTSDWTTSNATASKVSSSLTIDGVRSLRVINSSAGGYAQSNSVRVNPGQSLSAWADYRSLVGTAVLRLYDVTNGATLAFSSGPNNGINGAGGLIQVSAAAASTTRLVALRLEGTESNADLLWGTIILDDGRLAWSLPTWITERDQFLMLQNRTGAGPYFYDYGALDVGLALEEELIGATPFRVRIPSGTPRPLFVSGYRKFSALTSDADTTLAPLEWAKYEVASEAYTRMGQAWRPRSSEYVSRETVEKKLQSLRQLQTPRQARPIGRKRPWTASVGMTW
jgi:hypothetical protein